MPTLMRSPTSSSDPVFLIVMVPWLSSRMALSPRPSRKLVTHALLRSAAHGRKLGPTAGACRYQPDLFPGLLKSGAGVLAGAEFCAVGSKYRYACNPCQQVCL